MKYLVFAVLLIASCKKQECFTCSTDSSHPIKGHTVTYKTYCDQPKPEDRTYKTWTGTDSVRVTVKCN